MKQPDPERPSRSIIGLASIRAVVMQVRPDHPDDGCGPRGVPSGITKVRTLAAPGNRRFKSPKPKPASCASQRTTVPSAAQAPENALILRAQRMAGLVKLHCGVIDGSEPQERASVLQSKTQKPVRFEISEGTRASVATWMEEPLMVGSEYLWPGRFHVRLHILTRQYGRIERDWVSCIVTAYGTHSMRRTKVTQIYTKSGNLRRSTPVGAHKDGRHLQIPGCRA